MVAFTFGRFYLRRARRLFPALFATLLLSFVAAIVLLAPASLRDFSASAMATILWVSNIYFWMGAGYFDTASIEKPLLHTWSLAVEEQFYVFWPIIMLVVLSVHRRWVAPVFLVVAALASIASGVALAHHTSALFYLTPFRVFQFAAGAIMVWVLEWRRPTGLEAEASLLVGFVLIVVSIFYLTDQTPFPINGIVPSLGAALVIYAGQARLGGLALRNRLSVWIGQISYSVYLVHWPVVVFYCYYVNRALTTQEGLVMVAASIVGGALMHRFVETPFRYQTPTSFSPRRYGAACLAVAFIAVAGSASVHASNGLAWRYPQLSFALSPASAYGGEDCPYPGCTHGTSGREVLVVGDSFSRQLFAGLTTVFPDQRFRFIDQRTCAMFSMQWARWMDENRVGECKEDRKEVFDLLRGGAPLIMANHWGLSDFFDATEFARSGKIVRKKIPEADIYKFAVAEVERIKAESGSRGVMVVANPPDVVAIGDLQKCVVAAIDDKSIVCDHSPLSIQTARRAFVYAFHDPSMTVIDPYNAFCSTGQCENYDSGGFFYSDAYHLSRHGSIKFVEASKGEFATFLDSVNR